MHILSVNYLLYVIVLCIYNLNAIFLCNCHIFSDHLLLFVGHTIPIFQSMGISIQSLLNHISSAIKLDPLSVKSLSLFHLSLVLFGF